MHPRELNSDELNDGAKTGGVLRLFSVTAMDQISVACRSLRHSTGRLCLARWRRALPSTLGHICGFAQVSRPDFATPGGRLALCSSGAAQRPSGTSAEKKTEPLAMEPGVRVRGGTR